VRDTRGSIEAYLGGAPGSASDDAYYAASPVNFVNPSSPPTLLVHGERDPIVPASQTSALEQRLRQAGVKSLFVRLPWATHGCELSYGGPCGQITSFAVERFLDTVLTGPAPKPTPATRKAGLQVPAKTKQKKTT
jgi:acetyl esterase/lipase